MLGKNKIVTTIPVVNLERATKFYDETLGLESVKISDDGAVFKAGDDTRIYLYQRDQTKADHTVCNFLVEDVEAEVQKLQEKGVEFQEYDMPGLKTENYIATKDQYKGAWFKDTEGNILSISNGM